MSKIGKFTVLIVVLVTALGLIAGTCLAKSPGPPYRYTTYMAKCTEFPPEEVWVKGDMLYMKGVVTSGRTFGDPYFAGKFENRFDLRLNTVTGSGWVRGTGVIVPDAYEGSWQGGHFTGQIRNFVFSGHGFDYGMGELEGLRDRVRMYDISPGELPAEWADPCQGGPVLSASAVEGMIFGQ